MPRISSHKRYAQAAFELALEKGELEGWHADLVKVARELTDQKLVDLLENPKLPFGTKERLLKERLGMVNHLVLNLCCLLMSRGKLKMVREVSEHYRWLLDAHYGVEHAQVTTAVPLGDEDKQRLSSRLAQMAGRKVIIDAQTDPSIIGGFRARIGDALIDGSVKNALECLRRRLASAG
jgi:F-type H+-transporting ATPase subunit delta